MLTRKLSMPLNLFSKKRFSTLFLSVISLISMPSYAADNKNLKLTSKLTRESLKVSLLGLTPSSHMVLMGDPIAEGVIRLSAQMDADIAEGGVAYRSGLYFKGRPIYWANSNFSKGIAYLPSRKQALFKVLSELEDLSLVRGATKSEWCLNNLAAANHLSVRTEFRDRQECESSPSIGFKLGDDNPILDSILVDTGDSEDGPNRLIVTLQYSCAHCVPLKGPAATRGLSSFSSQGLAYVPSSPQVGSLLGVLLPLILKP